MTVDGWFPSLFESESIKNVIDEMHFVGLEEEVSESSESCLVN